MKLINRREFVKRTAQISGGIAVGIHRSKLFASGGNKNLSVNGISAVIPIPVQVVIDDVGWWSGRDGSEQQEPYRTGINRDHVPADYKAIVELGRALNIRPQAAMVLCEWDKENILRELPTSTWMGENWDNSKWVGPWMEEAVDIIRTNTQHFEFTIHGIGHEYWTDGRFTRAEWADNNGVMRPRDQVEKHLDYFAKIMNQHQLGDFPNAFVPTAFRHTFGPSDGHDISIAELLKNHGVSYINTPFSVMKNTNAVQHSVFGFDAGVMTVDRGHDLFEWKIIGKAPSGELLGPTCGMHWPNLLHLDPARNLEIVHEWVKFLRPYNDKPETMLAPNSMFFQNQLAHQVCTKVKLTEKNIELDFKDTDTLPGTIGKRGLTLKVKGTNEIRFKSDNIKIVSESFKKGEDFFLYTLMLERIQGKNKAHVGYTLES